MKRLFLTLIAKMTKTPLFLEKEGRSWLWKGNFYWGLQKPNKKEWIMWNKDIQNVTVTNGYIERAMKRIA